MNSPFQCPNCQTHFSPNNPPIFLCINHHCICQTCFQTAKAQSFPSIRCPLDEEIISLKDKSPVPNRALLDILEEETLRNPFLQARNNLSKMCLDCKKPISNETRLTSCKNHKFKRIEKIQEDIHNDFAELRSLCAEISETTTLPIKTIQRKKQAYMREVDDMVKQLCKEIQAKGEVLKQKINEGSPSIGDDQIQETERNVMDIFNKMQNLFMELDHANPERKLMIALDLYQFQDIINLDFSSWKENVENVAKSIELIQSQSALYFNEKFFEFFANENLGEFRSEQSPQENNPMTSNIPGEKFLKNYLSYFVSKKHKII